MSPTLVAVTLASPLSVVTGGATTMRIVSARKPAMATMRATPTDTRRAVNSIGSTVAIAGSRERTATSCCANRPSSVVRRSSTSPTLTGSAQTARTVTVEAARFAIGPRPIAGLRATRARRQAVASDSASARAAVARGAGARGARRTGPIMVRAGAAHNRGLPSRGTAEGRRWSLVAGTLSGLQRRRRSIT
ncbi:MAG: hypothetical protein ACYC3Q_15990 [Gemmatimonadaceae bacterium]